MQKSLPPPANPVKQPSPFTEARAYITLANDFDYADTNNDRRISRREFERW